MTFATIQTEVLERTNLTSSVATARVGRSINEFHRRACASVGIANKTERTTATATATIGNRSLTFNNIERILSVYNAALTPPQVLDERTFDELRNEVVGTDPPRQYAIQLMAASSVTIFLDTSPATAFVLTADVEANIATLAGAANPLFAEDFHDLLIYGALSVEYDKMEKPDLATKMEAKYENRLADLRYFMALSAYLNIVQGKSGELNTQPWPPTL